MKRRPRIYYSASQRALMWEHWRKGETLHQIARLFDRYHSSVHRILAESGGIRPAERHRSRTALTLIEREEIARGIVEGHSTRAIAVALGRAPSTISREIRRNDGPQGYRASQVDQAAWDRGCRPKVCKLVQNRELAYLVASKLRLEWSPEQVAGWLKRSNPDDEALQVSHETNSQIATLVERQSRYVMLAKVGKKDTETVVNALIKHAHKLPLELYQSPTWDRGKEMADHQRFTLATDIKVYFCDPHRPWQRGSNENTNGLLRQYLPKGIDLSAYSQAKLNAVARRLNQRPRKTLNYETPAERFHESVASIG